MEYISKYKASKIDSILTDVENSVKPTLSNLKKNTEASVSELRDGLKDVTENVNKKQDVISDLEAIREGASKGATAIQEVKTINGESIVGEGDIVVKGGNGSGPNIVTLNGDEVCDYYAINKSGEHVLASGYGCTHYIDCEGCGTMDITLIQNTSSINYGLAFYDADKKFISFVASKVGSEKKGVLTTVTIPSEACYFRATYFNYENQKTCGEFSCTLTYDTKIVSADGKRRYQDGFIYFSQRVNQSVTKYWSTDQTVANDANMKVTTGVLALPTTYKNTGRKTPLILYAHGLSHYVYYGTWGATETFPVQKQHWLDMGFAVMDCNGARDNNRSAKFASGICPQGINAYKLCVEYIQEHYNVSDDIFIVAGSAGGAVGWNFLSMYGKCVKAAVFLSAYSDMKADAYGAGGQQSRYVEFLGFDSSSTYEVDKTIGFDPALKIVDISGKKYCFDYYNTPIYAIYGSLDTYGLVTSMKNLIAALRNAGATAQIRRIEGVGHEIVSGANIMVDTEVGNWLLSHYRAMGEGADIVYHTVTYKYVDDNGSEIKDSVIANVMDGITINFANNKANIIGYEYLSVNPESATVTSDITVVYTYKKVANTYTITYEYRDADGNVIKESASEAVAEGTTKEFSNLAPTINGYDYVSVTPTSATITSDTIVVFTYQKQEVPDTPDTPVEGNDLSSLFTFDHKSWMCVINPQFKASSYFDSGYTDLSAYIGKTIRITVPQYTASNGGSSTGVTFWTATPTEQPSSFSKSNLIKQWDTHNAGNAKGILVEVETVVPADAPYIWTSTYNDNAVSLGVYVGENDGYTDFKCYIVE